MIYNNIYTYNKYKNLDSKFERALNWLKEIDLDTIEVGNYEIDGNDIYASVQSYNTKDYDELKFESHKSYIDIQYIIFGEEFMGLIDKKSLKEVTDYDRVNDIIFYDDPIMQSGLILKANDFVIIPPEIAHKPRVKTFIKQAVKKIVFKIKI